jgi:hypothetical protein
MKKPRRSSITGEELSAGIANAADGKLSNSNHIMTGKLDGVEYNHVYV